MARHRLRALSWLIVIAAVSLSACTQGASYGAIGTQITFGQQQAGSINPTAPGFADGLLGLRSSAATDAGPMPRWEKVMDRFSKQRGSPSSACSAQSGSGNCPSEVWNRIVAELKTLPLRARVEKVNALFNSIPYVTAEANWHDASYWETPYEFLEHGGQCQDYAIAKYLALLESGVPEQELRFLVVHDNQVQLDHAITVVSVDGDSLALDNQMSSVVSVEHLQQRYSPYYALNDLGWWPYMSSAAPTVAWQPPASPTPAPLFASSFRVARY